MVTSARDFKGECLLRKRIFVKYYEEARVVAESVWDLLHVGIWLHYAGDDMADSDLTEAKRLLSESRDIFVKLGQTNFAKQSEAVLDPVDQGVMTRSRVSRFLTGLFHPLPSGYCQKPFHSNPFD
jgi:hypothetical protein